MIWKFFEQIAKNNRYLGFQTLMPQQPHHHQQQKSKNIEQQQLHLNLLISSCKPLQVLRVLSRLIRSNIGKEDELKKPGNLCL